VCVLSILLFSLSLAEAAAPTGLDTLQRPASLAPIVSQLSPAVVAITVQRRVSYEALPVPEWARPYFEKSPGAPRAQEGQGSGFFISADGYLLTNHHVVDGADKVEVTLGDARRFMAKVVGSDERTDVALLKIDAGAPLPFAVLGESGAVQPGDWSLAVGNPFGLDHSVTLGIVSAKGRSIGAGPYDDFIQTQAAINPGNSGGPLFDMDGRVIGINTAIVGQGIGFSIPIDQVKPMIEELKASGTVSRGWLGVQLAELDAGNAAAMGAPDGGVAVGQVTSGTPAAKAGMKAGDVVVSIDGKAVTEASALVRAVGMRKPGETVKLEVVRDGKPRAVAVLLAARPSEDALTGRTKVAPAPDGATGDLQLDDLTVRGVREEGRFAGRLRAGDRILSVDGRPAKDGASVMKSLAAEGAHRLLVEREGEELLVLVAP
jgi:serine protease Do